MKKNNYDHFPSGKWRKILCFMRVQLVVMLCTVGTAMASPSFSQQQKIDVAYEGVSLVSVLDDLTVKTGYRFFYHKDLIPASLQVSTAKGNATIEEILNEILVPHKLSFTIKDELVIISRTEQAPQRVTVTGTVYDSANQPLPGVTVVARSGDAVVAGAATDVEGKFSIAIPATVSHLTFSFIGYITATMPVVTGRPMAVRLEEGVNAVDEVVVTGYQNIPRERSTGSTVTLDSLDIAGRGFTSVEQALMGMVSGLNMVQTGRPGQDAQIQIRGANSLSGSTDPIWIVDGMPMQGEIPNIEVSGTDLQSTIFTTGIGNLAPDDIKSITILKDASATAIYGARAANGVIVIETKSGTVGKTRFNASVNFGLTERPRNNIDMMSTAQKIEFERQIYNNETFNLTTSPGRITSLLIQQSYMDKTPAEVEAEIARLGRIETDWFREIFDPAFSQQYNFSMSGGNENTQHYASLNYMREDGTVPNNAYDRLGMNIKLTHRPSDKVLITGGLSATMRNDRSTASWVNPLEYAMYANPYERPYKEDGSYDYDQTWNTTLSNLRPGLKYPELNILDDLNRNTNRSRYLDAEMSLKLEWEIVRGLMLTSSGVYNINSNNSSTEIGAGSYTDMQSNWYGRHVTELAPEQLRGSLREATGYSNSYTWRNTLQYSKEFDGKHFITLFGGQEIYGRTSFNSFNFSPIYDEAHRIVGFPEMNGIDGGVIDFAKLGGTGKAIDKLSSFFANASYSYMDKYVLTGAIRYDGSDIIGNDNQFTPLWNVGARWNLHNERFIEDINWIDLLSLRAGFGYTGSIDKNALPFTVLIYGKSLLYNGKPVPTEFNYPNPNVKWQTKQDFNIGFEAALFGNRLELGVNYYDNITRDVLDKKELAYSSGRISSTQNVANIYNKGFEIDLGATIVRRGDFRWYVKANVAFNDNIVRQTYYKSVDDIGRPTTDSYNYFVEGYDVSGMFGYRYAGINPANGAILVYTGDEGATYDLTATGNDLPTPQVYYLGKKTPPVVGGFMTTLTLDKFLLTANFEFKAGHKIKSFTTFNALSSTNRHSMDVNRWRQPGDVTNVPRLSTMTGGFNTMMTTMLNSRLEKGDYLRCSVVTLGYNLDTKLLSQIGFSTARVSLSASNLFTLSKYRGIDPALMGNFDYPNSRKFTFTLNLGF